MGSARNSGSHGNRNQITDGGCLHTYLLFVTILGNLSRSSFLKVTCITLVVLKNSFLLLGHSIDTRLIPQRLCSLCSSSRAKWWSLSEQVSSKTGYALPDHSSQSDDSLLTRINTCLVAINGTGQEAVCLHCESWLTDCSLSPRSEPVKPRNYEWGFLFNWGRNEGPGFRIWDPIYKLLYLSTNRKSFYEQKKSAVLIAPQCIDSVLFHSSFFSQLLRKEHHLKLCAFSKTVPSTPV